MPGQVAPAGGHGHVGGPEAESRRRRGRGSRRTRSASRSAAGTSTRRCRSARRAPSSRSRTGTRSPRSAGTGSPSADPSPRISLHGSHGPPGRLERRRVGRVAQQRLADALAEDAALAARGAEHGPARAPCRRACGAARARPPGARSSDTARARGRLDRDPGQARARSVVDRAPARSRHVLAPRVRWPHERVAPRRDQRPRPASPAARPASRQNSSPAAAESGRWRTVTRLICRSVRRADGGSNAAATRSRHGVERSQARSTT